MTVVKRIFRGKDFLLGNWIYEVILKTSPYSVHCCTKDFSTEPKDCIISFVYDNVKIKRLIKKAYREMQKGNI